MDFSARMCPVPRVNLFTETDYFVWCGAMFKFREAYYLIYSRWEKALGFEAWATDSRVCLAKADSMFGKFTHLWELFDYRGRTPEERKVIHNPTVLIHQGRIYLYYMMNYGTGDWWQHRNRQRIGVAYTDDPEGEWTMPEEPVLDISPVGIDSLLVSNPSVVEKPDGKILMIYKAVSNEGVMPKGGSVICGAAEADSPLGPFRKYGKPLFVNPETPWSVEDPYVWYENGRYYALAKDFQGYFTGTGEMSTALFTSENGLDWEPDLEHPLAYENVLHLEDGDRRVRFLERPQLYFENGKPAVLLCACMMRQGDDTTYNIRIPLR